VAETNTVVLVSGTGHGEASLNCAANADLLDERRFANGIVYLPAVAPGSER
jgi:hypothetical protein